MKFRYYALKLSLLMVLIFILQVLIVGFADWFILSESSWFQPWRFVSAIFLHGGLAHLVFNLFALLLFGSILEKLIGGRRFLTVFFVTGILANIFSVNFYGSSLGASGAIFGVIGALIFVRPMLTVWAFGMPMPIFVAGILWAGADLIGAVGFFAGNPLDNTGNLAHLSGMVFGLVFGAVYKRGIRKLRRKNRIVINEKSVRKWEDSYMKVVF